MKNNILISVLAVLAAIFALSACSARETGTIPDDAELSAPAESVPAAEAQLPEPVPSSKSEAAKEPVAVRVNADGGLRMRGGPGTDYDIIKLIPDQSYARIAEGEDEHPGWLYVSYDGDSGWVSKDYISYEYDSKEKPESWKEVYRDYLSAFEPMTYTSAMYGGSYTVAGRITGGEKIVCSAIEFRSMDGYDYPVLVCWDGQPLDDEGNMDGPAFTPNIYLVENEKLKPINNNSPEWQTLMTQGEFAEPVGVMLASFAFKPENGGGPEEIEKALEWLSSV